jgi:hypothetical protein
MKNFLVGLIVFALSSCCTGRWDTDKPVSREVLHPYLASVSLLRYDKDMSENIYCSGTILYNEAGYRMRVLTAAHCVLPDEGEKAEALLIKTKYDKKIRLMEIWKISKELDVAFIQGVVNEKKAGPYTGFARQVPLAGENVYTVGNPYGDEGVITKGIVSKHSTKELEDECGTVRHLFRLDIAINPGNSGGGLFNTNGELVGIVVANYARLGYGSVLCTEAGCIELPILPIIPQAGGGIAVSLEDIRLVLELG